MSKAVHPGRFLKQKIDALGMSRAQVAKFSDMPRQHLYAIFDGERNITPLAAVRLAKFFGDDPRVWLEVQLEYDLECALHEVDTSRIRPFSEVLNQES